MTEKKGRRCDQKKVQDGGVDLHQKWGTGKKEEDLCHSVWRQG